MLKLNVLIAGSTGYIGIQLVNLLVKHKKINIKYLCGSSSVGKDISVYDKKLKKKKLPKIIRFNNKLTNWIPIYPVDPATNTLSLNILYYNNLELKKNYLLEN